MADKKELAARVLELVGGADNVVMATHCITRLRFNLKDDSKADLEALKTLDGALGAQVKDGQWQVIIGASVGSVYDELEPMLGDRMGGEVSADAEQPELQKGSARVFDIITGIFSAIIPALVAGGIVKGILAAIAAFGIDTGAGDFAIFNMISDIPFYFLPFLLAMSTADKFRVNRSLALCVAGSLMYPTIVNAVGTGETPLALFGFAVPIFSYADSVFPVIFGVIGLSFVYRAIDKVVPDLFKLVVVPALSLAIVIPVNLFVLAPIGAWCGLGLANGIVWLFSTLGPVAGLNCLPFLGHEKWEAFFMRVDLRVKHDVEARKAAIGLFELGHGYKSAAIALSLPAEAVRRWQEIYRAFGSEVLLRMDGKQGRYTYEQKVAAASAVVDGGMTKTEAMAAFGIMSMSPLKKWCALYRRGGAEALRPRPKGRPSGSRARPRTREEELEERCRRLEAEVAYLKKLRALVERDGL